MKIVKVPSLIQIPPVVLERYEKQQAELRTLLTLEALARGGTPTTGPHDTATPSQSGFPSEVK